MYSLKTDIINARNASYKVYIEDKTRQQYMLYSVKFELDMLTN